MAVVKTFENGSFLEYDRGIFDDWCVYYTDSHGVRNPPKDLDYFKQLQKLSRVYGNKKMYEDFSIIYKITTKIIDKTVLEKITDIASSYKDEHKLSVDILYTTLYMAMVAEENKANTKLGKRIKMIGVYSLLFESKDVNHATNFMRGMNWRQIDALCRERGF